MGDDIITGALLDEDVFPTGLLVSAMAPSDDGVTLALDFFLPGLAQVPKRVSSRKKSLPLILVLVCDQQCRAIGDVALSINLPTSKIMHTLMIR